MIVRRLALWLRDLFRRHRVERELDEEIRFHLDRDIERLVRQGLSRPEATRRARAAFGSVEGIKEECRQARDTRWLESAAQDARYGLRVLRRYPLFSATAVATLALTIGAVCTVASLAHTFFLRRLPVPDADEIVEVRPTRRAGAELGFVSFPDYVHFRDRTRTIESLVTVYPSAPLFVSADDDGRQVNGAVVSAGFFRTLRLQPALGRFFRPQEDRVPERDRVVVLGHAFWRSWFGGSSAALGASLEVNGEELTIVGVAPPGFRGLETEPTDLYLPTMMLRLGYRWCEDALAPDCTMLRMLGRLADDASIETARAEMTTLLPEHWSRAEPGDNSGVTVRPVRGTDAGDADRDFLELLGLVAGLLLVASCVNLAGLLLARGHRRLGELAIRASLGASRGRLVRQLLTESLLLALLGGGAGLAVSAGLVGALRRSFYLTDSAGRPLHYPFGLVPEIVVAALALALLSGLVFGMLPALIAAGRATVGPDRQARTVTGSPPATGWLLAGQASVAVVLVVVAGLLATSAARLVAGTNLEPERVALMRLRPRLLDYPPERAQAYLGAAVDRLTAHPGVESVSLVGTGVPIVGFTAEVATAGPGSRALRSGYIEIGPRYFETLGTPVLRGREFTTGDDHGAARVAVINETAARLLWPTTPALGGELLVDGREHTVIGVVADVPLHSRAEEARSYVYVPFWQNPEQVDARLQIRVAGDPAVALPTLVRTVRSVDPDVPVSEAVTLEWQLAGWFRPLRMSAAAVSYAGALAVVLAALGLYASLSAAVDRRTREIGVRQAIGASAGAVVAMITREGMRRILGGALVGLGLAALAARLLRHMLHGPAFLDAGIYVAGTLLMAVVGLLACWIPARRAARIDPMEALRSE